MSTAALCIRNVSPTAHFSQQLEKWAKEPFETEGFKWHSLVTFCCYWQKVTRRRHERIVPIRKNMPSETIKESYPPGV